MPKRTGRKNTAIRVLIEKDNEQEYGRITKALGSGRFMVKLGLKEKEVIGTLRGTMKKYKSKNFVSLDSIVLVSLRDFQDDTVDIIHVYKSDEIRQLKKKGAFIDDSLPDINGSENTDDICFEFEDI
jgi:initiation factor 1A